MSIFSWWPSSFLKRAELIIVKSHSSACNWMFFLSGEATIIKRYFTGAIFLAMIVSWGSTTVRSSAWFLFFAEFNKSRQAEWAVIIFSFFSSWRISWKICAGSICSFFARWAAILKVSSLPGMRWCICSKSAFKSSSVNSFSVSGSLINNFSRSSPSKRWSVVLMPVAFLRTFNSWLLLFICFRV